MEFVDIHCHLEDDKFNDDRECVIKRLFERNMRFVVDAGCNAQSSAAAQKLAHECERIYFAAGLHPECIEGDIECELEKLKELWKDEKCVAVGEIGLDYFNGIPDREKQKTVFERMIAQANAIKKPIVVHERDACADVLSILQAQKPNSGVMHCFAGSIETARLCLDMGLYISFGGTLTFKNAAKAPEVAAFVPCDRMVVETDSPYLAPVPLRGQRNEPVNVELVIEKLAEIKKISKERAAELTTDNAKRLFGITD